MKRTTILAILGLAIALVPVSPLLALDEDKILRERYRIQEMRRDALASLYEIQPAARSAIEHAAGTGVFSTFGIKVFFAGGTKGQGAVHNNRTGRDIYMKMLQVQAGLGLGAKSDRIIWVFETTKVLRDFINSGWEFGGQATAAATAEKQGGMFAGAFSVSPGVHVYQLTKTGLAASLTLTGTKYFKDNDLN